MYCIAVYDVDARRDPKMLKLLRQYLNWIQNSTFEGELSNMQLEKLMSSAKNIMELDYDSLVIYAFQNNKYMEKHIIGIDKSHLSSNFI